MIRAKLHNKNKKFNLSNLYIFIILDYYQSQFKTINGNKTNNPTIIILYIKIIIIEKINARRKIKSEQAKTEIETLIIVRKQNSIKISIFRSNSLNFS